MKISSPVSHIYTSDVSVIIPTYNRISMLEEALASIFSQEFDGVIEIIVIDDNSQDGTSEIIDQKYPEVNLISLKQNLGAYVARNRAILQAKGRYIAFLDSDDLWQKNYLKTQIAALEGKEKCFSISDIVTWNMKRDSKRVWVQKPNLEKYTSPIHHLLVDTFIYTPSCVVFPRQVFDEVGLFDETYRIGADTDMYTRCIVASYHPIFTDSPLAIRRKHDGYQATDASNLETRKKARLERINKLYPLIEQQFDIVSLQSIYAEIHASFASKYFVKKYYLHWLRSSIDSAHYSDLGYALSNMLRDLGVLLYNKLVYNKLVRSQKTLQRQEQ